MFGSGIQISQLGSVPTLGALLGNRGNQELLNSINKSLGSTNFFGSSNDRFGIQHNNFVSRFIEPIRQANRKLFDISSKLVNANIYRSLTSEEELRSCPPCMMEPILTYEPVFKLLKQGRIEGWGYTADSLVDSRDTWSRLIDTNGTIWYGIQKPNDEKEYRDEDTFFYGVDPYITPDDRIAIEETRDYIDKVLKETELDPTNIDYLRG